MPLQILYEDNHLIAVFKPAGVLAQADKTGDPTILDEVKYYLKNKYHKPGNVFLGPIHRLDRPASGILLLAKTSKGGERLSEQFREHKVKKIYHCLVEGILKEKKGTLVHYLKKDKEENKVEVSLAPIPNSQRAELDYELVEKRGENSLLKIELKTGRSHQIRSQLSAIGHPIVGDVKYGAHSSFAKGKGIALCATELIFITATGGEEKVIQIKPPYFEKE
jgi:23S rRNA pseudouridine1911/1915/1917 synthase